MELSNHALWMIAKAALIILGAFIAGFMGWLK